MKQKIIYIVLLVAGLYIPAGSKECGKVCAGITAVPALQLKETPTVAAEEINSLPASPLSRSIFTL